VKPAEIRRRLTAGRDVLLGRPPVSATEQFRRDGRNRLLIDGLGLTADSVAFDIGGYCGDYTASLLERYRCRVYVFEPVPAFADQIDRRFRDDARVVLFRAAIGPVSGTMALHLRNDATSTTDPGDGLSSTGPTGQVDSTVVTAEVMAIGDLDQLEVDRVDLLAMNIEGGEYELIPLLAESGWLERVDRLLIQFHEISPTSRLERERCHLLLAESHRCDWDYPFVWESWSQVGGGSWT
jgi:FkbM family methyltransferase